MAAHIYYIKKNGKKIVRESLSAIKTLANAEAERTGKAVTVFFEGLVSQDKGKTLRTKGKLPLQGTYSNPSKKPMSVAALAKTMSGKSAIAEGKRAAQHGLSRTANPWPTTTPGGRALWNLGFDSVKEQTVTYFYRMDGANYGPFKSESDMKTNGRRASRNYGIDVLFYKKTGKVYKRIGGVEA
jgi:hypothetical protein